MSETSSRRNELSPRLIGMVLCLRAARSVLGLSQRELAKRTGVSEAAINRLERFDREPRLDTVLRIEEALSVAGIEFERRSDGKFELVVSEAVIDDMAQRIQEGAGVTSRGRIDTQSRNAETKGADSIKVNERLIETKLTPAEQGPVFRKVVQKKNTPRIQEMDVSQKRNRKTSGKKKKRQSDGGQ